MLETNILNQVRSVFQNLEAQYTFHITCHPRHESAQQLTELLKDVAGCSDKLSCEVTETEEPKLEFSLLKNGKETGVKFRGIPNGHEFTSFWKRAPSIISCVTCPFSKAIIFRACTTSGQLVHVNDT